MALLGPGASHGAEVDDLRAALERAQQENARLRQQLGASDPANAAALQVARVTPPPPAADSVVAQAQAQAPAAGDAPVALQGVSVRARPKLAALKEVPVSATAIAGDELEALGAVSSRDIARRAGNITRSNSSNARSMDLSIRGIGRKGSSEAQDPNIGITVDGVSYGYTGLSAWEFVDVESVEVLRGPTGTTGGKNASVGGLNVTTKKPSFVPSTDVSLRLGQRDGLFGYAAVGGPVVENLLAWRGTFYVSNQQGDYANQYDAGDNTYTDRHKISGKVQALLTPTPGFTAHLSVNIQPETAQNDNGLNFFHAPIPTYANGQPTNLSTDASTRLARRWFGQLQNYSYNNNYLNYNSGLQNQDNARPLRTGTRGGFLNLTWDLPGHQLTSITSYNNLYFDARNDEGTPFDISTQGGGGVRYVQFTQELRLSSEKGGRFDYQTGLYYIRNRHNVDSKTGWGSDAGAWFATPQQYTSLDADAAGRYLLGNSLNYLRKTGTAVTVNKSPAVYASGNWHVTEEFNLNSGIRLTHENRNGSNFARIENDGYAPELNAAAFSNAANGALSANNTAAQIAAANAVALKYFGVATYNALSANQKQQVAYAKALRANQLGRLYDTGNAIEVNKNQLTFNLSPSYRFSDEVTGYVTYQHGEKAPVAQFVNGFSANALPETTNNIELGAKTLLLDRTLTFNANVFLSKIRNYQQTAYVVDQYLTAQNILNGVTPSTAYTSLTGNAPKVEAKGLEVDGVYSGLPNTTFRVAAAYNDARYKSFPNSPQAAENANLPVAFTDVSGQRLPGAAKYTGNLFADYRLPLGTAQVFHTDFNYNYTSSWNSDSALSQYGWIKGYGIADLGIGLGARNRSWDVTLLVKNLFNYEAKAYGFSSGTLDTNQRWVGVVFSSKL